MKYWISVATQEHTQRGQAGEFLQIGHGKRAPLARIKKDDWVIFYAPKVSLNDKTPVEAFISIGQVEEGKITKVTVNEHYQPYRRPFHYLSSNPTDIKPLIDQLKFIPDKKNWQFTLRHGLIGISKDDFGLISEALLAK